MSVKGKLKVIKGNSKNNISGSISQNKDGSFRSYNITGKLIELNNFVSSEGIDYSKELVSLECGTTLIINDASVGALIFEECEKIFTERKNIGDLNPALDLVFEANTVKPLATNILIVNLTNIVVDKNTQLKDNASRIEEALLSLRKVSNARKLPQSSAAREGIVETIPSSLSSVINAVHKISKTYL